MMTGEHFADERLVLIGCGRMGGAMLKGWLARGLPASSVWVVDPSPAPDVAGTAVRLNEPLPADPTLVVVAVKPQLLDSASGTLRGLAACRPLVVSVAAGVPIARFEALGDGLPVVRAMPNTPAAIGRGITALVANDIAGDAGIARAEALLAAVGETVRLDDEAQMDAVTAVSGSGPAYVFHLIEAMAAAGRAEGLPPDLALTLARATVAGAGALAMDSGEDPSRLREAVTSPGGTTAAALDVLMDEERGLNRLVGNAVRAAARRSRELGA
jgi:pyrroline-5-carboxylate reductase